MRPWPPSRNLYKMRHMQELSAAELARYLGCSRANAYRLIRAGEVPSHVNPATGGVRVRLADARRLREKRRSPAIIQLPNELRARIARLETTTRRLEADLRELQPAAAREADSWRKQALAARAALVELTQMSAHYEAALAAERDVAELHHQAAGRARDGQDSLRRALGGLRTAIVALAGPADVDELLSWPGEQAPRGRA